MWKWVFLMAKVAKVASENLQSREVKIDTDCWTEEKAIHGWCKRETGR